MYRKCIEEVLLHEKLCNISSKRVYLKITVFFYIDRYFVRCLIVYKIIKTVRKCGDEGELLSNLHL